MKKCGAIPVTQVSNNLNSSEIQILMVVQSPRLDRKESHSGRWGTAKESKKYLKIRFGISTLIGNCKQYGIKPEGERVGCSTTICEDFVLWHNSKHVPRECWVEQITWSKSHGANNPLGQIYLSFSLWDGCQQNKLPWVYSINCCMITLPLWQNP